jgi:uncharacterized protein affecting Mg2+/Co2+ transport
MGAGAPVALCMAGHTQHVAGNPNLQDQKLLNVTRNFVYTSGAVLNCQLK